MNGIRDGIMRKNQINAALTEPKIERNKAIIYNKKNHFKAKEATDSYCHIGELSPNPAL
jgi:hypothetical protein